MNEFDAKFDEWREKSLFISPAQYLADNVYDALEGDPDRDAAIESLAKALDHGEKQNVEAWVRRHLARFGTRVGKDGNALLGQVVYEMFTGYVNLRYDEGLGATVTAGGNEKLAALRARAKKKPTKT